MKAHDEDPIVAALCDPRRRRSPRPAADITIGISLPLTGPTSAPRHPDEELHQAVAEVDRRREAQGDRARRRDRSDQGREEREDASSPRTRSTSSSARPRRRWRSRWPSRGRRSGTLQLMLSPAMLPAGKDTWAFRLPQSTRVMALRDDRAHEEAGRQDRRLPRLHRRLRRRLAERLQGAARRARPASSRSSRPSASRAPTPASPARR